jgi:hypothetical protein
MIPNSEEVRSLQFKVNFPAKLPNIPQVMISPVDFDMDTGFPFDWHIEVLKIDHFGF